MSLNFFPRLATVEHGPDEFKCLEMFSVSLSPSGNLTNGVVHEIPHNRDQILMSYTYMLKLLIIGDMGVGKSNLLKKYIEGNFQERHITTIGVQFGAKIISVRNVSLKLQIWDTAGQQAFISITRGYFRAAAGAVIVFDLTSKSSFENVGKWLNEAREHSCQSTSFVLVGNKADLKSDRAVSSEQARQLAIKQGLPYLQVSAKAGQKVDECFSLLAQMVLDKIVNDKIEVSNQKGVRAGPDCVKQHLQTSSHLGKGKSEKPQKKKECSC